MKQTTRPGGILLVCDANVCRSPLGEFVMAEALAAHRGFVRVPVESRGVAVAKALDVCAQVATLRDDPSWEKRATRHRSRAVDVDAVLRARLVLTASRSVRASVATLAPDARRRIFTMREAAWLAEGYVPEEGVVGVSALTAFARHLDGQRGILPLPREHRRRLPWQRAKTHPLDIGDGHLHGDKRHAETVRDMAALSLVIAERITGPAESGSDG